MGTPGNGPSAAAWAWARSNIGVTMALSVGLSSSTRSIAADDQLSRGDLAVAHRFGLGGGVERGQLCRQCHSSEHGLVEVGEVDLAQDLDGRGGQA